MIIDGLELKVTDNYDIIGNRIVFLLGLLDRLLMAAICVTAYDHSLPQDETH